MLIRVVATPTGISIVNTGTATSKPTAINITAIVNIVSTIQDPPIV